MQYQSKRFYIAVGVSIVCFVTIGFLIGFFAVGSTKKNDDNTLIKYYESLIQDSNIAFRNVLINEINSENIKKHLKNLTSYPHIAGEEGDLKSANYVYDNWVAQKLDYVQKFPYEVYLSYPSKTPNNIEFKSLNGTILSINITEPELEPDVDYSKAAVPFLAFGMQGSVTSDEVIYANYGAFEDFEYLKRIGINVTGKIVICKYGYTFRGDKVLIAEKNGAKAVILYDDPQRSAPSVAADEVYPHGEFLPEEGTQRGTLYTGSGDPLTPLYPSTASAYKIKESESDELPTIVAQVVGYKHAKMIFELMDQNEPVNESDWKGSMNVTYTYGGKLKNGMKLTVNVKNERKFVTTYNVIGIIKGETEPDQYVMLGNHRDAWTFGSVDPTSGTASMLEISRTLSLMKQEKKWKPKRSIIFLSWGAEEYGLVGSIEWVEEFNKKLTQNAIAYLNMDISVQGNYSFTAKASPLLHKILYEVTRAVKISDNETVFDRWYKYAPNEKTGHPVISTELSAASDYTGFQQRVGIPCLDARYNHEKTGKYSTMRTSYALYHTNYETFNLMDKYLDPGFKSFKTISTVIGEITRVLSDSLIIPFNTTAYVVDMYEIFENFKFEYGKELTKNKIDLKQLQDAIDNFSKVSMSFEERLKNIDKTKIFEVRRYNDQLKNLERAFLDPEGVNRKGYMHMLSAPSLINQYGGDGFPALSDAAFEAVRNPTEENWDKVKFELSVVIYVIQSASSILNEPINFDRSI